MLISVIIPVYNTEKYISTCINSVLNQTHQEFEIIVVDDKTPDGSMKIVESMSQRDPRIRIVHHESNKGLMMARQSGYKIANGKYLMFLDSDDTLMPDALEVMHRRISNSQSDIVVAGFNYVDEDGIIIRSSMPKMDKVIDAKTALQSVIHREITHNLAFCIFKAKLFKGDFVTYLNQTNGEDLILFYQLLVKADKIDIYPHVIYNYKYNISSSTKSPVTKSKIQQYVKIQTFKYDFLKSQGISEEEILKNIIPALVKWFCFDYGIRAIAQLPQNVQKSLKLRYIYNYLPFVKASALSVVRFFPLLSPLLRRYLYRN